jgi:predicted TIM-barrel fold metal-dependent hydrolase
MSDADLLDAAPPALSAALICDCDRASRPGAAPSSQAPGIARQVRALLAAELDLAAADPQQRYLIDQQPGLAAAALPALDEAGVRGLRIGLPAGRRMGQQLRAAQRAADIAAPLDWHIELALAPELVDLTASEWILTCLPVAVCLSGVAELAATRGPQDAEIGFILDLLQMGRTWLKLSGPALASGGERLQGFVQTAAALRPDRIVWGSGVAAVRDGEADRVGGAFAALARLLPDEALRHAILVDNPARLYRF